MDGGIAKKLTSDGDRTEVRQERVSALRSAEAAYVTLALTVGLTTFQGLLSIRVEKAYLRLLSKAGLKLFPDKCDMREHCLLRSIRVAVPHCEKNRFVLVKSHHRLNRRVGVVDRRIECIGGDVFAKRADDARIELIEHPVM